LSASLAGFESCRCTGFYLRSFRMGISGRRIYSNFCFLQFGNFSVSFLYFPGRCTINLFAFFLWYCASFSVGALPSSEGQQSPPLLALNSPKRAGYLFFLTTVFLFGPESFEMVVAGVLVFLPRVMPVSQILRFRGWWSQSSFFKLVAIDIPT